MGSVLSIQLSQDCALGRISTQDMKIVLVAVFASVLVAAVEFTEEETAAIAELKEAGLLEVDIEKLLDEAYDELYPADESYDELLDLASLDIASERGGPGRRRRPGQHRRHQRPETRRSLLQILVSRLLGVRRRVSHPSAGYGLPTKTRHGPPKHKPSYVRPKPHEKKKRPPPYKSPKPAYSKPSKPLTESPHSPSNGKYGDVIDGLDEYEAPKAPVQSALEPSYSAPAPSYEPKPAYKPKRKHNIKYKRRYKSKRKPQYKPSRKPSYKPKRKYKPRPNHKPVKKPSYKPPSYEASSPPYDKPSPSYDSLSPSYNNPAPSYHDPSPSYNAPTPSYDAPSPSHDDPSPSYDALAPSYDAPSPSYDDPTPSYDAPSLSYEEPELSYESPDLSNIEPA